jgi:hypothetical protein
MKLTHSKHLSFAAIAGLFVTVTLPLVAQTPTPYGGAGSRPVAVLLCQYSDVPNTYGVTTDYILAQWMSNTYTLGGTPVDNSINGLVQEASGGTVDFRGTRAFGWYTLPNPKSFYRTGTVAGNDCIGVAQRSGVDLAPFTYVAVYLNDSMSDAAGLSWPATLPTRSPTKFNALIVNRTGLVSPPLVLHELGHILSSGGQHTDSGTDPMGDASWYGTPITVTPYYASTVSPGWDASRRELMGFIGNVATYSGGTQTYNLSRLTLPYPGMPSAIDVPLPNGAKYVISARTRAGHDARTTYSQSVNKWGWTGGDSLSFEGVEIELLTSTNVDARLIPSATTSSSDEPANAWQTGQSYTDAANKVTITINNFDPAGNPTARITVTSAAANALPPGSWQPQGGLLTQISVGSDGTVMGVNGSNLIYQWNGTGWNQLPGAALLVSVVNSTKAFIWDGNAMFMWNGSGWIQVNRPNGVTGINWLSAASDGTLYAVDTTGNVNRLDANANTWSVVGSNAGHVAAQSSSVFYMLQNGSGALPIGTIQKVSGATVTTLPGILLDIAVDSIGDLWGSGGSQVWHWNGSNWDLQPGTLTQIAVGNFNTVWALNVNQATRTGTIFQWR